MIEKSIFKDGANKNLTHPKENKGITLVALIITIIVMMILVAVTVAVIINSDLLGTAQEAGRSYKENADAEGNLSGDDVQITVGGETYNSLDAYKQTICSHKSFDIETDEECPDCGIKKISFTIKQLEETQPITFYALEGMTWDQWLETNYNTGNYVLDVEAGIIFRFNRRWLIRGRVSFNRGGGE